MSTYVLGHGEDEVRRLELQAELLAAGTRRVLRAAGIAPGLSVLDVGTGAGDVAMIAAELVGPSGSVLGIDRGASVLERARQRAEAAGLTHVDFDATDLGALAGHRTFDAVVWRYVLHHQADPVIFLRQAATLVRPGGELVCIELDVRSEERRSNPPIALIDEATHLIIEASGLAGVRLGVGGHMVELFQVAGLPEPDMPREDPIGGSKSPIVDWIYLSLQTLVPVLEAHGVTTGAALGMDSLLPRMKAAASEARSQIRLGNLVSAWTSLG